MDFFLLISRPSWFSFVSMLSINASWVQLTSTGKPNFHWASVGHEGRTKLVQFLFHLRFCFLHFFFGIVSNCTNVQMFSQIDGIFVCREGFPYFVRLSVSFRFALWLCVWNLISVIVELCVSCDTNEFAKHTFSM